MQSHLEFKYREIYADQRTPEVRAKNYPIDAVQKGDTQENISAPRDENSLAQEHEPQQERAQVKGQKERLTKEAQEDRSYEPEAQEIDQEHGVQETGHKYQTQKDGQEDRAYGDGAYDDAAHNDKVQGGRQVDEAQEVVQEDKAQKGEQDGGAYEDDVREYRVRKRRIMTEESDDGAALRAQQVREG